jgi:pantothenate synthetase
MRTIEQVDKSSGAIISLAIKVGSVRLIDNIIL